METILRDLQEECRRLGEEAAKKIEEKYVGKGAVILSEVHWLDKSSRKATIQKFTILSPKKICPDLLTLLSGSRYDIKIYTYTKEEGNNGVNTKITIHLGKRTCKEEYDKVFYNDTIQFIDKQVINELVEKIKSSIPDEHIIIVPTEDDTKTVARWCNSGMITKEGERFETVGRFANQFKKDLEDYLNEGL